MGIDEEHYVAVPPDPTDEEMVGVRATLRALTQDAAGPTFDGSHVHYLPLTPALFSILVILVMSAYYCLALWLAGLHYALAVGLLPALRMARTAPHLALKEASGRASSSRRERRFLESLVSAEVALTFVLLFLHARNADQFIYFQF